MTGIDKKGEALLKWFEYKNSGPHVPDNDVSFAHVSEYAALHGFPQETVCRQKNSISQYELHIPQDGRTVIFRGDTLTSVWTRLRGCLELAAEEGRFVWNRELFGITPGGRFRMPDFTMGLPGFAEIGFKDYLPLLMGLDPALCAAIPHLPEKRDDLLTAMAAALPHSFFDFLAVSRDPGNLILCPLGFNAPRGGGSLGIRHAGEQDTADHLAFCFARHFRTGYADTAGPENTDTACPGNPDTISPEKSEITGPGKIDTTELEKLGPVDTDKLLEYFRMLGIADLSQCREKLLLQDLIDGDGRVLSFKTGRKIPEDLENYNPQPRTEEEYRLFFKNAAQITQKRTARIAKALAAAGRRD